MDPATHHHDPAQQQQQLAGTPSSTRKRSRENETPSQRHKREKAAERQRRKRERDRQAGLNNILALSQQVQQQPPPPPQTISAPEPPPPMPQSISEVYAGPSKGPDESGLSAEEATKRERVRAAARERQRKHRALVKARKMRELGMDMGNELMPGMDDVQYRMTADGQYQPVLPHDLPPQHPHSHPQPHPHPHAHPQAMHEPPFPQTALIGGQTFASTLLLSFSCAPLLKQHLLRTLNMTNEELASLEPIIAQAWDHWDQQRRIHYAQQAASGQHKAPDGSAVPDPASAPPGYPTPMAYVADPSQPQGQAPPSDFRARFQRSLVAPSPFRNAMVGGDAQASVSAGSVSSAPGPSSEAMNTQMSTASPPAGEVRGPLLNAVAGLDPQLGQARDEAAGVAGKLERS